MVTMVFIGGLASVDTTKRLLERENLTSKEALEAGEAFERKVDDLFHIYYVEWRTEILKNGSIGGGHAGAISWMLTEYAIPSENRGNC
ncbi:unnamed protein product [Haemonchus placei]|uniref:DUF2235 domain-containing protein n=1 Tax=Haemonchus placei TaxID=6290 RepID=A0A0N4VS27_HAEPC|nr:unnamed protein product [Haemonchus placei]